MSNQIISRRRWLVWCAALVIMGSAFSGIWTMHRWSAASHRAVHLLSQIESQANRLSALEWEAMARKALIPEIRRSQQFVRQQLNLTLAELNRYVEADDLQHIRRTYNDYIRAIDEEFGLLGAQRFADAQRVDDDRVDPTYDNLVELINQAQIRYENSSQWTIFAVNIGSFAVLTLAAISIGILFSRFEKLERIKHLLLVEQNALRKSEERFRSLVHNTSDIIAILDPLPPKIQFISESIRRILGHRPVDLIGTDFCQLIHPDDAGKMQRFIASCAFSSGSTHVIEVRLQHGKGHWAVVEIFGDNRVDDAVIGGIVLNIHDVSERQTLAAEWPPRQVDFEVPDKKLH
ncbi:MAG TPA: PAS domain S-box protein [Candidatus Binatus sp.]|nr:PAS domain S-box protein [Candidatus Binatus sp.]